jgi:hypothetical protein
MGTEEHNQTDVVELGAAVRFFQCGSDITIQTNAEGLSRLSALLKKACEGEGITEAAYTDPDEQRPGIIRIESVGALTTTNPPGRKWVVPIVSMAGVIWVVVLPLIGVAALLWFLITWAA